jgi:hypothetical protein
MFDIDEAILKAGKHLAFSDTESGTYTNVDGTTEMNFPDRELGKAEVTNDDSPDRTKQYIPALYEPGTVSFKYIYGATSFDALETIYQLAVDQAGAIAARKWWKITLADGAFVKFEGFLTKHTLPLDGLEDAPIVEGEIQVSGAMVYTPPVVGS